MKNTILKDAFKTLRKGVEYTIRDPIKTTLMLGTLATVSLESIAQNNKRATINPDVNTAVVVGGILGVDPFISLQPGHNSYKLDFTTDTSFNKHNMPLKFKTYSSDSDFVSDVSARITKYENNPRIQSDKKLLHQYKISTYPKISRKDTTIKKIITYFLNNKDTMSLKTRSSTRQADTTIYQLVNGGLSVDELNKISKEVATAGYTQVLIPILVYHEGGTKRVKENGQWKTVDVKAESIPMVLQIPGRKETYMQNPSTMTDTVSRRRYVNRQSTSASKSFFDSTSALYAGLGIDFSSEAGMIPNARIGIVRRTDANWFSNFGLTFGYGTSKTENSDNYPTPVPPAGTVVENKYDNELFQLGLETGFKLSKDFKLNFAAEYNIHNVTKNSRAIQTAVDLAGNVRQLITNQPEEKNTRNFWKLIPGVEYNLGKNFSAEVRGKYAPRHSPSLEAGVNYYFRK